MDDNGYAVVSPWMENGNIMDYVKKEFQANPLKLVRRSASHLARNLVERPGHS